MLDKSRVHHAVCNAISYIHAGNGKQGASLHGGTKPFRDLDGFDSYSGAEASCAIEVALGCSISPTDKLFGTNTEPHSIDEIVNKVCEIIERQEPKA